MGVTLDSLGFDSELQALYMAVSSEKTGQKRKRTPDSSHALEGNDIAEQHVPEKLQITDFPTGYCLIDTELKTWVKEFVPNQYICLSSVEHKRKCFAECPVKRSVEWVKE